MGAQVPEARFSYKMGSTKLLRQAYKIFLYRGPNPSHFIGEMTTGIKIQLHGARAYEFNSHVYCVE